MTKPFFIFLLLLASFGFDAGPKSPRIINENQVTGLPVIRNYLPSEYNATPQNWSILKDKRGIMYFANTGGVLEFDGVEWRLIPVINEVARTLAIDKSGIIYVGGVDEFGYLQPDTTGLMNYISLVPLLPPKEREFGDIWSIYTSDNEVYFQSSSHIFRIIDPESSLKNRQPAEIKTWTSKKLFSPAFYVNGKYYVPESGTGLMSLNGDSLQLLPGGGQFAGETIYDMLSYSTGNKPDINENKILIGTALSGFYLFDGKNFTSFKTEADNYIQKNKLYFRGGILSNNTYVFGTQTGGMIVINDKGKLLQVINKTNGLSDNTVWYVYPDDSGILWLGLNNGISRIIYPSPLTLIDSRFGIDGLIFSVNQFKGSLYISTPNGVYHSPGGGNAGSYFKLVDGINSESWELLTVNNYQLAATTHGVYKIENNRAEIIKTNWRFAYSFCRSRLHPDIIYVGLHDGLAKLKLSNSEWTDGGRIPGLNEIITQVAEESDGTLWLSSYNKGIIRVIPDYSGNNSSYTISHFDKIVNGRQPPVVEYMNRVIIGTPDGPMNFNPGTNNFVYDPRFGDYFRDFSVTDLKKDAGGSLWITGNKNNTAETGKISPDGDNKFNWEPFPQLKIIMDRISAYSPYKLFPDKNDNNLLWATYGEKLYRFDLKEVSSHTQPHDYYAVIRKINLNSDSTLYYGGLPPDDLDKSEWTLPSETNSVEINYSSSSYFHESGIKYHYSLSGFDNRWSDWTTDNRKEYTNLSPGTYEFTVQAKNILGEISKPASFTFYISSPWYSSVWAIVLFSLLLISGIWWVVNLRFQILEKRNIELEDIVNKRTNEVRRQKDILEEQAQKLLELDRLKTNFFANISHEFRTPLTLIMGQIESILGAKPEEFTRRKLKTALSNSKQLQALINRLLELTKLESGEFRMKVSRTELNAFLRKILSAFESLTERQNIKLEFNRYPGEIYMYLDREKIEEVFNNLISNAIKFTPGDGQISLTISSEEKKNGNVKIYVSDTGIGIKDEDLAHIFDRFYQADSSQTREYEGTGIGLAIVKELIQLHKGIISVASTYGKGTEFCIQLKTGKDHFVNETNVDFVEAEKDSIKSDTDYEEASSADEYYDEQGAEGDAGKEVVLVVEDNHDMRNYIRENLENDYRVIPAKNGEEGVKKALEFIPDLIITDVMMPAMNGFELTGILKADNKTSHIPIIMLTAKADEESKLKGLDKGVDDYLIKPFSTRELYARVGNLIKLRRLLKERYNEISAINPSEIDAKPIDKEFIDKVFKIIKEHLEDQSFSVTALAGEVGMSVSQLNRKLNALINQSAGKLIRSTKLDYASQLLKNQAGNISEIAYRIGFSDLSSFTNSFKEKFGVPPRDFLKK